MSKDTLQVNLDVQASAAVKEMAEKLGISEIEVIRLGLIFMNLYTRLTTNKEGRILVQEDNNIQELVI